MLVAAAVSPTCFLYQYGSRFTALIAKLSFSLYLLQKGVIHIVQPLLIDTGLDPKGKSGTSGLVAAGLAAWVLNKTVEEPFLKLRLQYWKSDGKKHSSALYHSDRDI